MNTCKTCHKPKANYKCGLCEEDVCKGCVEFLAETFSFKRAIPASLKHPTYCGQCFDAEVAEPLQQYNETMEKAREVFVFTKDEAKLTRLLAKKAAPYHVENCEDEEEALLRMSFFAVEDGFNCLVNIVLDHKKIIVGSHKKTIWSATATPENIDPNSIRRA